MDNTRGDMQPHVDPADAERAQEGSGAEIPPLREEEAPTTPTAIPEPHLATPLTPSRSLSHVRSSEANPSTPPSTPVVQNSAPSEPATLTEDERDQATQLLSRLSSLISQRLVGQEELRDFLMMTMMAGGHILIESVPGLAKTTAAKTLAQAVSASFSRIQGTPDLMPADIVGTQIYSMREGTLNTQLGPIHANFVLFDEINRASAKTQSAMLQAMEEKATTIGGADYSLPSPFMVMATQNPIEEEGTYDLPEAQMDRFFMKHVLPYPSPGDELEMMTRHLDGVFDTKLHGEPLSIDDVTTLQRYTRRIYIHQSLRMYIVDLINTTRGGGPTPVPDLLKNVRVGASPRGSLALMRASQAHALLNGRLYVVPDDIQAVRYGVLRHRIVRTYDAIASAITPESIIDSVFAAVPVP